MRRKPGGDPHGQMIGGLYWFLVALFLTTLLIAVFFSGNSTVERFAPNATTEIFGIIITVAVVQRLLQRQERARRMRASIGAFRRAGRGLSRLIAAWAAILKGCHPDDDPPRSLGQLLGPNVTDSLGQLDLRMRRVEDGDTYDSWARWLLAEIDGAMNDLNRVAVAYGAVLEPVYTEAIDELIDDPFIQLVRRLVDGNADANTWRTRMNMNRGHREDYFRHLLSTAQLHDRLAAEAATVRSRERGPRTGALGMELDRDHDLKVNVRLDGAWRAASPAPASLRSSAGARR